MKMKFRKKPVVIEAFQWRADHPQAGFPSWAFPACSPGPDACYIDTLEGRMRADDGDWIIKGVKGEVYPCKPDIFNAIYDPVEESGD